MSTQSSSCLALLIAACLFTATTGQIVARCADFNEYCQNHWDCCSNTCMMYLYRCTRNYDIFPYAFLGSNYAPVPVSSLEDIYALNFGSIVSGVRVIPIPQGIFGRFGGDDEQEEGWNSEESLKTATVEPATTLTETTSTKTHATTVSSETLTTASENASLTMADNVKIDSLTAANETISTVEATTTTTTAVSPKLNVGADGIEMVATTTEATSRASNANTTIS